MKKIFFCFVCFWGFSCQALTTRLSRTTVQPGESVELIISSSTPIGEIDFSHLSKDFMLGGKSSGQSSQYINGVGSTNYQRSIVLFPFKEGSVKIPSLIVGQEKTDPLTLTVKKGTSTPGAQNILLPKLKAEISEKKPYVGQSLFYILSLSENDDLVEAELIPNLPEGIKLSSIGQDTEEFENNKVVLKRPYLIKTEKVGTIEILPAVLNGTILYKKDRQFQPQGLFSLLNATDLMNAFSTGTRPFQVISNPISLNVQDKPLDWEGWWLPTTKATLKMVPEIPSNLKAGDIFKITLNLTAQNVDSNDLPIPKLANSPDFRYYPQPEERHISFLQNGNFQGSVQISYEIMPLKEGQLTLPEIKIPWFNTATAKKEIAEISPLPLNVKEGKIEEFLKPVAPKKPQVENKIPKPTQKEFPYLSYIIGGGILLIGLSTFWTIKLFKKKKSPTKKEKPIPDFYPF